jgi:hypothetical protein
MASRSRYLWILVPAGLALATVRCSGGAFRLNGTSAESDSSGGTMGSSGSAAASGSSLEAATSGSSDASAADDVGPSDASGGLSDGSSGDSSDSGEGESSGLADGSSSSDGGGGSGVSASGAMSGSSSGAGSGSSNGCPPSFPMNVGGSCPAVGLECEYGTSPKLACNQLAQCEATGWTHPAPGTCGSSSCPLSYDSVTDGDRCDVPGSICAFPKGTCNCAQPSVLRGPATPSWDCIDATTACRSPRPDLGTPCTGGATCNYGACEGDIEIQCTGGKWQEVNTLCPAN